MFHPVVLPECCGKLCGDTAQQRFVRLVWPLVSEGWHLLVLVGSLCNKQINYISECRESHPQAIEEDNFPELTVEGIKERPLTKFVPGRLGLPIVQEAG